ncbi:MAG: PaaI family thioesterase [Rhodocyclaceae bacterium]|nr:PaaI family thioesterase [Rhodocyclaceae bacterium]
MDALLAAGRKVLAEQPFSVLLGAELLEFSPGHAVLAVELKPELKQQYGFAHGGVLSYLADNALTYAGGSALGGHGIVTSEFKINYLRPALGERLVARADSVYTGKSQSVCRCDVFAVDNGQEKLCATAQGTVGRLASPAGE